MDIAIIADDFTGANANGALLTAKGFSSATCLGADKWNPKNFAGFTAVSLNAESRLLSRDKAWEATYAAVMLFAAEKPALISKRVDSTLRGNIGAELEAAVKAMDDSHGHQKTLAVLAPSYPSSGRICVGGYVIVHGIPLERSPIAQDAATPIKNTSALKIVAEQSRIKCGFVPLEKVLCGVDAVNASVMALRHEGCRVVLCDAVSDEDIAVIAQALAETDFPLLAVDPGPFTAELAAVRVKAPRVQYENRVFISVGSTSELTRTQLEALRLTLPCHIVTVDVQKALEGGEEAEKERDRIVHQILKCPKDATVLGLCTAAEAEDVFSMEDLARCLGISPSAISQKINDFLSGVTREMLGRAEMRFGGLYTSGGEVTVSTIRALGSSGFAVRDQVLPLAVYGHIIGGAHPDMPMVTKGGFVGEQNSLVECIEYLFTKISTRRRRAQET
jgi:uncharacterized protein YgbK (DUF1537 family)